MRKQEWSGFDVMKYCSLDPQNGMIYSAGVLRAWKQMIAKFILLNFISSLRRELKVLIFKFSAIRTFKGTPLVFRQC